MLKWLAIWTSKAIKSLLNGRAPTSRPGSRLSCREVSLAEPDEITDNELICDVAFPLGSS